MENWAKINDRYEVSDLGRVRSLPVSSIDKKGRARHKSGKVLTPSYRSDGYLVVNVSGFRHKRNWKVHQLVAIHFLGDELKSGAVNHKNGIKDDNRAINLEWCSAKENNLHAYRVLKRPPVKNDGAKNAMSKKVINPVTGDIYESASIAARQLGLKRTTLTSMLSGINQNHTQLRYL